MAVAPVCAFAVVQPDGTYYLGIDPVRSDLSTCAFVVETGSANGWRELGNMTIADAQLLGAAVVAVWAIAWGFRALAKFISSIPERYENE